MASTTGRKQGGGKLSCKNDFCVKARLPFLGGVGPDFRIHSNTLSYIDPFCGSSIGGSTDHLDELALGMSLRMPIFASLAAFMACFPKWMSEEKNGVGFFGAFK